MDTSHRDLISVTRTDSVVAHWMTGRAHRLKPNGSSKETAGNLISLHLAAHDGIGEYLTDAYRYLHELPVLAMQPKECLLPPVCSLRVEYQTLMQYRTRIVLIHEKHRLLHLAPPTSVPTPLQSRQQKRFGIPLPRGRGQRNQCQPRRRWL